MSFLTKGSDFIIEQGLPVVVSVTYLKYLKVENQRSVFERLVECAENYYSQYKDIKISHVSGVNHARQLFRALGIDPTKRRPSSEALLNRALKKQSLYQINTLVDVGNWCSLDFLLPIGIYDAQKLSGRVRLEKGTEKDAYIGLNNRELHFNNRYVLKDDIGAFGSPILDSKRTCIELDTTDAILILYAPVSYPIENLSQNMQLLTNRCIDYCGGEVVFTNVYKN